MPRRRQSHSLEFSRAVGHVLRSERLQREWGLDRVARGAAIHITMLSRVERAVRPLDLDLLRTLCTVLDITPADVIQRAQDDLYPMGWPTPGSDE